MFERHFALRENPFTAGHQLKFLYPSREHQEARAHLRYGIENREPFLLITGEVGTGKTTSLYDALAEWGDQVTVALITNSALTRQELLEEICLRFGLTLVPGTSKPQALALLERHLIAVRGRGAHAVLLLDEAQNLPAELLEEIRLLSNLEWQGDKLLQIFLVGQPELEAKLARPELRQLRQRITVHYRLNPLSPEETTGYIHHRLSVAGGNAWSIFPPDSCLEVYRLTHGIPREINTLASAAMLAAYAEGAPSVQIAHVQAVAHEAEFRSVIGVEGAARPAAGPDGGAPAAAATGPAAPPAAATPASPPAATAPAPVRPEPVEQAPAAEAVELSEMERRELAAWAAAAQERLEGKRREPASAAERDTQTSSEELEAYAYDQAPAAAESEPAEAAVAEPAPEEPRIAPSRRVEEPAQAPAPAASLKPALTGPPAPSPELRAQRETPPRAPAPVTLPVREPAEPFAHPDMRNLPPRLREKLEEELAREPKSGRAGWLVGTVAVVAIAIALVMMQRFGAIDLPVLRRLAGERTDLPLPTAAIVGRAATRSAAQDSAARAATAPAPSPATPSAPPASVRNAPPKPPAAATNAQARTTGTPARPASAATQKPAVTSAPPAVRPQPTAARTEPKPPAPAPARTATSAPAKPAAADTSGAYGVSVGQFLDQDRANSERERLAAASGLPAQVVTYQDAGATMFRVVLGRWPTRAIAEQRATALMERGVINEARVMLLSKRAAN